MREIKFRAWDKTINSMCDVGEIHFCVGGILIEGTGVHLGNNKPGDTDIILMQFTGLKDKNGVEIYEGDIIKVIFNNKAWDEIDRVKWGIYSDDEYVSNVECWMVGDYPISDSGGLWGAGFHEYEIIGNIYENPEVLNAD